MFKTKIDWKSTEKYDTPFDEELKEKCIGKENV